MQRRDAVLRAIRDHPISQRRIGVLLERVGMIMNEKKLYRITVRIPG
jgi:hypothetical protein